MEKKIPYHQIFDITDMKALHFARQIVQACDKVVKPSYLNLKIII